MSTTLQVSAGSKAPHWSAIHDIRVAADIAGAGASGEFTELGAEAAQIYGAAIGVPNAGAHSGYGVFTDANNNTIVIATESRPAWGMIQSKNLLGKDPYIFHLPRNMGSGGAFEANAYMIAGIGERFGDYAGWVAAEDVELTQGTKVTRDGSHVPANPNFPLGLTLQPYINFPQLLTQIENTGRKFDRPIVILSSGQPITLASVLNQFLSTVLIVAKPFAELIGIPPALYDALSASIQEIVVTGKFSFNSLANVSQLVLPKAYRSYLPKARDVYAKIESGDYLSAMSALGVTPEKAVSTATHLLGGDVSKIIGKTSAPVTDVINKVQAIYQMDTVRALTAATRSGSVMTALTDAGTMTKVPLLQNLLTTTSGDTLVGALPSVSDIMQVVVNETRDITNVDLHKGALQLSLGQMVGSDTFDDLTIIGLKQRANELMEQGAKSFVLPVVVPDFKKIDFARAIADDVGQTVLFVSSTGTQESVSPNDSKEWR